jgi:hypothetical protein
VQRCRTRCRSTDSAACGKTIHLSCVSQCCLCCCLCARLVGTALGTSTLETAITVVHNGRKLSVTTPVTTDRVDILDAVLHEEGECFLAAVFVTLSAMHNFEWANTKLVPCTESAVVGVTSCMLCGLSAALCVLFVWVSYTLLRHSVSVPTAHRLLYSCSQTWCCYLHWSSAASARPFCPLCAASPLPVRQLLALVG